MKKLLILASVLVSTSNAFATGSINCVAEAVSINNLSAPKAVIEINATTSRVYGSPIVGSLNLKVNDEASSISTEQITGFWNRNSELKILALDENYDSLVFELNYNTKKNKGILTYNYDGREYKSTNITCELE